MPLCSSKNSFDLGEGRGDSPESTEPPLEMHWAFLPPPASQLCIFFFCARHQHVCILGLLSNTVWRTSVRWATTVTILAGVGSAQDRHSFKNFQLLCGAVAPVSVETQPPSISTQGSFFSLGTV